MIENFQGIIRDISVSAVTQNLQMSVRKGDFASLRAYLSEHGVSKVFTLVLLIVHLLLADVSEQTQKAPTDAAQGGRFEESGCYMDSENEPSEPL